MTTAQTAAAERTWHAGRPVDLHATLGSLRRGRGDPAFQVTPDGCVWWATCTPDGPGSLRLGVRRREQAVVATAWGPGAGWLLDRLPGLLGATDDVDGFVPGHPLLEQSWRRHRGWRVPLTGRVFEACAAAVVAQKVTGTEARSSWRLLLSRFGEPAPGPTPPRMHAPPPARVWAQLPPWEYHRAGVTPQRARALLAAAAVAGSLEALTGDPPGRARQVLTAVPGVGRWTAAEVAQRALGDADAVSFGDFHLGKDLCFALTGERGDDDRLRVLLDPWAGHRYRVQRLVELLGVRAPRRGPRFAPPPHRRMSRPASGPR